nr:hypothetical protein [Tanacetum cinerariifolium]
VDPFNPPPPASESKPEDVIEVKDMGESEDETVPASVHEKGKAKDEYYGKLILDLGNEVRFSVEEGTATMESLARKLSNVEETAECKKLKKELEEEKGFMFEERPNEAIDVPVKDKNSPSSEPRGSLLNVIPPDHVDDVPVVELNQHDDVPVVPDPVLVDEDEDPEEKEFEKEEEPQ